ncbi:MAG: phosphatidate cytidylyltransferase [Alphaproteobacteria bacterium]|nr:phosphatidate cytidylyltransferase [Alphaproteobacteria bacterium]
MLNRILSALVALPIVLVPLYLGGWYLAVFVWAMATLGCYEWVRLANDKNIIRDTAILSFVFAGTWLLLMQQSLELYNTALAIVAASVGVILLIFGRRLPTMLGAVLYILLPCLLLLILPAQLLGSFDTLLQNAGQESLATDVTRLFAFIFLLSIFVPVWLSDIGALALGKMIGGAKLAPSISPNKTWAGLGGAIVGANLLNLIALPIMLNAEPSDPSLWDLWLVWIIYATFIGLISQAGDLFMSSLKRKYGAKDTGAIMPGHGGLLDRIDGLLMVLLFLPLLYYVLAPLSQ